MKLFTNLQDIAVNKDVISHTTEAGKWRSIEYRTKLGSGQLLVASVNVQPEPVTFRLNLKGWYKIYVCLFDMMSENYCFVKLSDDEVYTPVAQVRRGNPRDWQYTEYMQEFYWKCADLTNQDFILAKPDYLLPSCSGLSWIRCEEMAEEEIALYIASQHKENKCVQMHFDPDSFFSDRSNDKKEHFANLHMLKNTNMDFCTLEYSMLYDHEHEENYIPLRQGEQYLNTGNYTYEEMFKKYLSFAHENNFKLYAAHRMSMANFYAPFTIPEFRNVFIKNNRKYYCRNRDGSTLNVCSYAYEEVQQYVIEHMLNMIKLGFDGISMIMHRGIHIAFDQPVLDRFYELYPEIDPHLLPITDERLHGVWCEFMTAFMAKVRKALDDNFDRHIPVNVITDYGLDTAKHLGLDVETWAKNGLIDCLSQADMETYEDLTDCMSTENPSLIDLDKYKTRLEDYQIIKRKYGTNVEKVCAHIPEYLNIEEKYGTKVYHVLPWMSTISPERYMDAVEQLTKCGAKRFLAWNTNHICMNWPEFHMITTLGNPKGLNVTQRQFYRVLSLDHSDISQYNPNWRG